MAPYTPILILMGLVFLFTLVVTAITFILGPKNPYAEKLSPFECGIPSIDAPTRRFPIKYLVTGMLFIVFDIEAASLLPLSILMRRLGVLGLVELTSFIAIVLIAFVYVWRKGAFTWD